MILSRYQNTSFTTSSSPLFQSLLQVLSYDLAARLALLPPLRTRACLVRGVLAAPAGVVAVAFMYIVGLQHLMAWNSELAMEALDLFHRVRGCRVDFASPYACIHTLGVHV